MLKKKIWVNFQRIIELFTPKIVTKPSKIWVWDPGSRGQKDTGSRIRIRNTGFHRGCSTFLCPFSAELSGSVSSSSFSPLIALLTCNTALVNSTKGNWQSTSECLLCSSVVINQSGIINKNLLIHNSMLIQQHF